MQTTTATMISSTSRHYHILQQITKRCALPSMARVPTMLFSTAVHHRQQTWLVGQNEQQHEPCRPTIEPARTNIRFSGKRRRLHRSPATTKTGTIRIANQCTTTGKAKPEIATTTMEARLMKGECSETYYYDDDNHHHRRNGTGVSSHISKASCMLLHVHNNNAIEKAIE
jgi:hypothetical protein